MAYLPQAAAPRTVSHLLGREPRNADWQESAPLRLTLVLSGYDRRDLFAACVERIDALALQACRRLQEVARDPSHRKGNGAPEFRRLIRAFAHLLSKESSRTSLDEALEDAVWETVDAIVAERTRFFELCETPPLAPTLLIVREALMHSGTERGSLLREARGLLMEAAQAELERPVVWTLLGWLVWMISENPDEARPLLLKAAQAEDASVATHYAHRLLGHFAAEEGEMADAYDHTLASVRSWPSADAQASAASYAARIGRSSAIVAHADAACAIDPLLALGWLSDDRLAGWAPVFGEALIRSQENVRRDTAQRIAHWEATSGRLAEAQRLTDGDLELPEALSQGFRKAHEQLADADVFVARWVGLRCSHSEGELVQRASFAWAAERTKRQRAITVAKAGLEKAWEAREAVAETAGKERRAAETASRNALRRSMQEGDRTLRLCVAGWIGGGVIYGTYLLVAIVLSLRGPESNVALSLAGYALAVAAIPVTFGTAGQIAYGLRRVALDGRLRAAEREASSAYARVLEKADETYRLQVQRERERLEELERALSRLESASHLLETAPPGGR